MMARGACGQRIPGALVGRGPAWTWANDDQSVFDGWDNAAAALGLLPALRPGEFDGDPNAPLKPHELNACKLRAHAERAPAAG